MPIHTKKPHTHTHPGHRRHATHELLEVNGVVAVSVEQVEHVAPDLLLVDASVQ